MELLSNSAPVENMRLLVKWEGEGEKENKKGASGKEERKKRGDQSGIPECTEDDGEKKVGNAMEKRKEHIMYVKKMKGQQWQMTGRGIKASYYVRVKRN